jgi:hypothetical protein
MRTWAAHTKKPLRLSTNVPACANTTLWRDAWSARHFMSYAVPSTATPPAIQTQVGMPCGSSSGMTVGTQFIEKLSVVSTMLLQSARTRGAGWWEAASTAAGVTVATRSTRISGSDLALKASDGSENTVEFAQVLEVKLRDKNA